MTASSVTLLERRRLEAAALKLVYDVLVERLGPAEALEIIGRAVETSALADGAYFAAQAPDGPGLEHFATVLERLTAGGALEVEGVSLDRDSFAYTVRRCRYVEQYRAMGIGPDLAATLSCRRDAAFARGYSPDMVMERPETIAQGADACRFVYRLPACVREG